MEFDRRLAPPPRLCSDSLRRVTVAEPRPVSPFFGSSRGRDAAAGLCSSVRARTLQSLGWLTEKMAARVDGETVQLSGHPARREPTQRGSGARRRRTDGTVASIRGVQR